MISGVANLPAVVVQSKSKVLNLEDDFESDRKCFSSTADIFVKIGRFFGIEGHFRIFFLNVRKCCAI